MPRLTSILFRIAQAAFVFLLASACSDGDGLVSSPTLGTGDQPGVDPRPSYDANLFFAASGVDRSFVARYGAESSYDITLKGFVGNQSKTIVSDVRVMIQLFDAGSEQVGVQVLATTPQVLGPGQFSQYLMKFGPFTDPSIVNWYRVTPYNRYGKGLVLEQALGL